MKKPVIVVAAADPSQLVARYDAAAVAALEGNCRTRIILGKPNPDEAEQIAKLFGKTPS